MEISSVFLVLYGRSNRETPKMAHVCGSQEYQGETQELRYAVSSSVKHSPTLGAFLLQLDEETVSPVMPVRPSVCLPLLVVQRDFLMTYFCEFSCWWFLFQFVGAIQLCLKIRKKKSDFYKKTYLGSSVKVPRLN